MTAVMVGLGSWLLAALMKLTGKKIINCMPEFGEDIKALEKAKNRTDAAKGALSFNSRDASAETPEVTDAAFENEGEFDSSKLNSANPSHNMASLKSD